MGQFNVGNDKMKKNIYLVFILMGSIAVAKAAVEYKIIIHDGRVDFVATNQGPAVRNVDNSIYCFPIPWGMTVQFRQAEDKANPQGVMLLASVPSIIYSSFPPSGGEFSYNLGPGQVLTKSIPLEYIIEMSLSDIEHRMSFAPEEEFIRRFKLLVDGLALGRVQCRLLIKVKSMAANESLETIVSEWVTLPHR